MQTHLGQAASATLYRKLPFDPIGDFEPIGVTALVPMVIIGPKSSTAKDIVELVAQIKSKKDGMTIANGGLGSGSHFCGMLFMTALKTQMQVVPYRSAAPAMTDVLGGRIDVMCDQVTTAGEQARSGAVKGFCGFDEGPAAGNAGSADPQRNRFFPGLNSVSGLAWPPQRERHSRSSKSWRQR